MLKKYSRTTINRILIVIGLFLFILFPFAGIWVLIPLLRNKNSNIWIVAAIVWTAFMTILGFYFRPLDVCDVHNYWYYISRYEDIPLKQAFNRTNYYLYVTDIWFWLIAQSGNKYLFSATSCLMAYGIYSYIFVDWVRRNKISKNAVTCGFVFLFGNIAFVLIASSARNFVSMAFFILAGYWEYILDKKKKLSVCLYVAAVFIHNTTLLLVLLRIVWPYVKKYTTILCGISLGILPIVMGVLSNIIENYEDNLLTIVIKKVIQYYYLDSSWNSGGYYVVRKWITYALFLLSFLIIKYVVRMVNTGKLKDLVHALCLVEVMVFPIRSEIYTRFMQPLILVLTLALMCGDEKIKESNRKVIQVFMVCAGIGGFMLNNYLYIHMVDMGEVINNLLNFRVRIG